MICHVNHVYMCAYNYIFVVCLFYVPTQNKHTTKILLYRFTNVQCALSNSSFSDRVYSGHHSYLINTYDLETNPSLWLSVVSAHKVRDIYCSYAVIDTCCKELGSSTDILKVHSTLYSAVLPTLIVTKSFTELNGSILNENPNTPNLHIIIGKFKDKTILKLTYDKTLTLAALTVYIEK